MEQAQRQRFLKKPGWLHRPTRSDLLLMIASLFIAALLWAYIASRSGYSLKFTNIPVIVDTTDSKAGGYRLTALSPATGELTVNAELSGSRTEIGGLSKSDLEAYVDFDTGVTDTIGYQTLPIRLRRKNGTVLRNAVLSVNSADVQLDKIKSIALPVTETVCLNLKGADEETHIDTEQIEVTPKTVTVSGPSTIIQQLDHVRVRLNDSETLYQEKTFTDCGDFDLIGSDGNAVSKNELKVQAQFDVTVPVYYVKKLPVTLELSNDAPAGFDKEWLLRKLRLNTDREYMLSQFAETDDDKLFIAIETRDLENKAKLDAKEALSIGSVSLYDIRLGGNRVPIDIKMQDDNINRSNIDKVYVSLDEQDLSSNSFRISNKNDIVVINAPDGCAINPGYTEINIIGDADEVMQIMSSVSDIRASVDLLTATITQSDFQQVVNVTLPDSVSHVWFSPAPKAGFTVSSVSPNPSRYP